MFKSMLFLSMLLLFYHNPAYAQEVEPRRNHAINSTTALHPNVPDTLAIVAVRVEFQPDENRLTTGNGTFQSGNLSYLDKGDVTIDPLPHDSSYFSSHLEFAKNYFEQVSGQQIAIEYRLLPNIYQLPRRMENYSPTGENFTNEKVAKLVTDTWTTVENKGGFPTSELDPEKTAFIIFHAGVGRDIELTGTTLDKTPQDIPSLFMGQVTLSNLLNDPDFVGFDINNGTFKVTNSLVLPRTLSRPGEDVTGKEFVLELSINGLLSASIGSYLGLPDLFNTETGNSGIGRFGLMDGESFFSYRGLFPPEPSAWEKIFLGWQSPFSITKQTDGAISLPSAGTHQNSSIAKLSLSSQEYFLIENRHRDPNNDGVTLTFRQPDGSLVTRKYSNQDEAFVNQTNEFTSQLERGVVTNVSNFEWSLPGGLDYGPDERAGTADDRELNGGILIWHIDEAVIQRELADQRVNANPRRRGVDLEEADGAQDIGRPATEDFSRQARGTAFDFWWDGNNASVVTLENDTLTFYENRFGPDTRPSNESNSGALSFLELYDFSGNIPTASFRIRPRSSSHITPVNLPTETTPDQTTFTRQNADYFPSYPLGLSLYTAQSDSFLIIPSQQSTYALRLNSSNSLFNFRSGQPQQPYLGRALILGQAPLTPQMQLNAWQWDGNTWDNIWTTQPKPNDAFISSQNNQPLLLDYTDQRINIDTGKFLSPLSESQQRSATLNGKFSVLNKNKLTLQPDNSSRSIADTDGRRYTGSLRLAKNRPAFYYLSDTELLIFEPERFDQPKTIVRNIPLGWPAMTDVNEDGQIDFVYVNKASSQLEARNLNGAMLPHFPIAPPEGTEFVGTPLITRSDQSGNTLYITSQDSLSMNINAYNTDGSTVEGFPLYVGGVASGGNEPIHPILRDNILYAVSHLGELKAWQLSNIEKVLWGGRYGMALNNKVSGNLDTGINQNPTNSQQVLVKRETYNWPNPAEDYTYLRFQTGKAGSVDVKIVTASGTVVYEKRFQSSGSAPEEHRISTRDWSSGVYFAMITARVGGETDRKMIKVAVIH